MNTTLQIPRVFFLAASLFSLAACGGGGSSSPPAPAENPSFSVILENAFPALTFVQPLAMVQPPGDGSRWFLAEQGGRVLVFPNDPGATAPAVAIDLTSRVVSGGEAGLLGIAFHPDFALNGQVFLSYTAPAQTAESVLLSRISRFTSPDRTTIDPASEEVLLTLDQPFANHNGGNILFGPDGFLYIGFGDGGSGGDPRGNAQNTSNLFGAILRIDVDSSAPYAIPPDNPFVQGGGAPEIFAWGLRNPWRFTFDRATGLLWAGDVGQNAWEEVNILERGGNSGWNIREGAHCFPPETAACETAGLIDPVAEYQNAGSECSVTGGYVYRGSAVPELAGTYLFGDFCSGRIWGLPLGPDGRPTAPQALLLDSALNISSFAEGIGGEVFVLDLTGGGIHRIAAQQ